MDPMSSACDQILIVDDDRDLRDLLEQYLAQQGYKTASVGDGVEMEAWLRSHDPDLIILDLMLPGEDGLTLAHRLRARGGCPVIMLSARGEEIDRVVGLEVGADDYLAKPCSPRELLARIRAVLRRSHRGRRPTGEGPGRICRFGPFRLDLQTHHLARDGNEIGLTAGDYALLRVFVEHPNRVLTRDQLLELLSGYDRTPFDRSIDVRIARLRRKIEADPAAPAYIRTVWGEGYIFLPDPPGGEPR
jgi:two-component system, OmpR family, phosphate regulon response regulator OmpR